jgi:hypothetical protein
MELTYRKLSVQAIVEKAATQDRLFVTRFAKQGIQDQVVQRFEIVTNEGPDKKYKPFYILSNNVNNGNNDDDNNKDNNGNGNNIVDNDNNDNDNNGNNGNDNGNNNGNANNGNDNGNNDNNNNGNNSNNGNDNNNDNNDPSPTQQLLECHIIGEISFVISDTYGDWVPEGETNDDLEYSTPYPNKAAQQIRLNIPEVIVDSLKIVDKAVNNAFPSNDLPISKFYGLILDDNQTVARNKVLMHRKEWKRLQNERKDEGDEFQGNPIFVILLICVNITN